MINLSEATVRRHFNRAASSFEEAAVLQREVESRLLERLDDAGVRPRRILDLGCGTGSAGAALHRRFPDAEVVAVDFAEQLLRAGARRHAGPRRLVGHALKLPIAAGTVDLVFSNLLMPWIPDVGYWLVELRRIMRQQGLFLFSGFGPDTLTELRSAWASVDQGPHVHEFIDMHLIGDGLLEAGFINPVMDMENLTVEYADARALVNDLRATGATNALTGRFRGLTGRRRFNRVLEACDGFRRNDRLPAAFEVVYGHAIASSDGSAPNIPA